MITPPPQSILSSTMWIGLTMEENNEPGTTHIIIVMWGMSPSSPGSDGGGEAVGNNVVDIHVVVIVGPN